MDFTWLSTLAAAAARAAAYRGRAAVSWSMGPAEVLRPFPSRDGRHAVRCRTMVACAGDHRARCAGCPDRARPVHSAGGVHRRRARWPSAYFMAHFLEGLLAGRQRRRCRDPVTASSSCTSPRRAPVPWSLDRRRRKKRRALGHLRARPEARLIPLARCARMSAEDLGGAHHLGLGQGCRAG